MKCDKCKGESKVINVAEDVDEIIRLRECTVCKTRFYTAERNIDFNDGRAAVNQIRNYTRISKKKARLIPNDR